MQLLLVSRLDSRKLRFARKLSTTISAGLLYTFETENIEHILETLLKETILIKSMHYKI